MIEFMLLAAPRSATAWASNWLTTDRSLCLHDPLNRWTLEELDQRWFKRRILGIACTVSALLPHINAHAARKVVLHRTPQDVHESMDRLHIRGSYDFAALDKVDGRHYDWQQLFEDPAPIYEYLLRYPFDAERHEELRSLNVQNTRLIRQLQIGGARAFAHG
jgi:hypothetical protein